VVNLSLSSRNDALFATLHELADEAYFRDVLLVAAGDRAVLTVMADPAAKLGLVLYDMKATAGRISQILA
jgi:predicted regulator of Ras-like GTPase activity (Roadblock/LC7/MglB family)